MASCSLETRLNQQQPVTTQIPMIRRRKPLRSKTADTLFKILSFCHKHRLSDKGDADKGPITKDDVPLDRTDILANDSLCQKDASLDETRVAEPDAKDAEEGEISGDFMDFTREDSIGVKSQLANDNNLVLLSTVAVEDVGKDMTGIVNKNTRNLVDYSEIAAHAKQANGVIGSDSSLRRSGRVLRNSKTRNQDLVNQLKRQGPSSPDERVHKKAKKLVDITACSENTNSVVDASVNKDAAKEKQKKKRVLTQESKAKKKRKARIKRAEERIKNGVIRPKLQVMVKEKQISICRHYMHGKCYEGEKCNFSHNTIPLTKSKPCVHFARHSCMKGDDCPYDHQLSKYPCNKLLSTGECNRGSNCLFSHEAQPIEPTSDTFNRSKTPDQDSPNSGSKTPKSVDITPKVFTRPPKGVSFFSQKTSPSHSEVKETTKTSGVTQDPKESTKTPRVVPAGINFLSFGKKPDSETSTGGFSFKISNGIGKSPLGKLDGDGSKSDPAVKVVNDVKVDVPTDRPSFSQKALPIMPFMSSASQKALQSTLAFASKFEAGVKTNKPGYH